MSISKKGMQVVYMATPKKQKKQGKKLKNNNPPVSAVVYNGPTRLPGGFGQNDMIVTQINNAGTVAASAGGVINTVFDAYSQMSTPGDWANISQLWTEYRILSMEIEFVTYNTFNWPTTTVLSPIYSVEDRANNTVLGSIAQAVGYDSVLCTPGGVGFSRTIKMASMEEAGWTAVGSSPATASRLYVKLYSSGNTASVVPFDFVTRIMVQLRGRQ